jgi:nucleoside-diphosphate-sugar epimerase
LAEIGKKACLKENLIVNYDSDKPDGQFRKDVDSSKLLSALKDFKFTPLDEGIKKVYDNFSQRYNR